MNLGPPEALVATPYHAAVGRFRNGALMALGFSSWRSCCLAD